jgi:hypothetical protein
MTISTGLRLKKTPVMSNMWPTALRAKDATPPQPAAARTAIGQTTDVLDAVLLIVNEDMVGQDDRAVAAILATALLEGRSYQQRIDEHTQVHVVVRSYAQDAKVGLPMGQSMFRRLQGDQFDQERMASTSFAGRRGVSGVIIAQWRSSARAATSASQEHRAVGTTAPCDEPCGSMAHWSWWAERSLLQERAV